MRISDWSSDVCSSDLHRGPVLRPGEAEPVSGGFPTTCGNVSPRTRGMYADSAGPVSEAILFPGAVIAVLATRADPTAPNAPYTPCRGTPRWTRTRSARFLPPCTRSRSEAHTSDIQIIKSTTYA